MGYATARKIGCHAQRTRQRRRARAAFNEGPNLDVKLDIAVLVKESAIEAQFSDLVGDIAKLLKDTKERWEENWESC